MNRRHPRKCCMTCRHGYLRRGTVICKGWALPKKFSYHDKCDDWSPRGRGRA